MQKALLPNDSHKNSTCLHKKSATLSKPKTLKIVTVNSEME